MDLITVLPCADGKARKRVREPWFPKKAQTEAICHNLVTAADWARFLLLLLLLSSVAEEVL